jgi:hypothetical protein
MDRREKAGLRDGRLKGQGDQVDAQSGGEGNDDDSVDVCLGRCALACTVPMADGLRSGVCSAPASTVMTKDVRVGLWCSLHSRIGDQGDEMFLAL